MVIKIIENSVKNLGLPLLVFDNFDTSFVDCQSGKIILAFFDDSIPNITGIPPLEYEKILIYRKSSQPLKGFDHYIKKPFLPTEILSFIKPKIPQDLQSSASPSSLNLGTPSIAIPTTQASAELAAIAQSLDSELLEPSSPTPAENLEENLAREPEELETQEDLQELESSAIPALKATLDDENFIDLPDINSFEDLDNFVAHEMQDFAPQAEPSTQTAESTPAAPLQDTPSQDTYNESELLDFDAVFDKKDDAKIALDEVDTDDFLKDFDLDDLHERGEESKHAQAIQPEQDLQDSLDSTQPTQILNPKDIDEIKRLLQETAISESEESPSTQTHRADPLHAEPSHIESTALHTLDSAIAAANAMASSSLDSSPTPSDAPHDDNAADFASPTPMEASLQTSLQNPMQAPQAQDAFPAPRSIREHLDEDFVSALKDIEGDIESLSIDEGEILEALNQNALQNAKNLQTPAPQAQSLSCSGAEFIELIKNTPSEELQKLFGSSKILLEIDFNKQ